MLAPSVPLLFVMKKRWSGVAEKGRPGARERTMKHGPRRADSGSVVWVLMYALQRSSGRHLIKLPPSDLTF